MSAKRYVLVGVGSRAYLYLEAVVEKFPDQGSLVGLCDTNAGRLQAAGAWTAERGLETPLYPAHAFEQMIADTRPDIVIVVSMDATHDDYIVRAMELGCDVISEKPMTTDAEKCQRILDTQRKTGRAVRVVFNYRYSPPTTQVKELLMSGVIGDVLSVDFHWLLDTNHGADYFRRWHRRKCNSGGLLVHKATHHFDMVNWWLSTVPEQVYAVGSRQFYTPKTALRYGLTRRGERCLTCADADECSFYLDLRQDKFKILYLQNEQYDGYYRDRCVFSDDIDIEDNMQLVVNYRSGATMSYSLHAFMPWEGRIVAFNGSKGRLEHTTQESTYISGDGSTPGELVTETTRTRIIPHFQAGCDVDIWQGEGGHGGADPLMVQDIFVGAREDKYLRAADYRAGAWSVLTGIAANRSLETGRSVRIDELIENLPDPDYPPMPTPDEPFDPELMKTVED